MEGNGGGGDDSGERCIEEHPVKGGSCVEKGRAAYPFNSHGVNDSQKKKKRRTAKMPKSQLARIYRFLPRGKRKLKLRFLLCEASRPFDGRLAVPRCSAHHRAKYGVSRRSACACTKSALQTH